MEAQAAPGEIEASRNKSPNFCRIINTRHMTRLLNFVRTTFCHADYGPDFSAAQLSQGPVCWSYWAPVALILTAVVIKINIKLTAHSRCTCRYDPANDPGTGELVVTVVKKQR